jgi:hypothetical protein
MTVDEILSLGDDAHAAASNDAPDAVLVVDDSTGNHAVSRKDRSIG